MMQERKDIENVFGPLGQREADIGSIGKRLAVVIRQLPADDVTLAEIRNLLGKDGLLLLVMFLTIVFLIPVSIPGVSTVFGAAILLIGISRLLNMRLWLPKRLLERQLPAEKLRISLNRGAIWLQRLERISHSQRLGQLACDGLMGIFNNCALITATVLLMAPFGLIPFSNTLPALAILFFAIGFLQRDGVCILFGYLVTIVTFVYFTLIIVGGGASIRTIFQWFV